MLIRATIPFSCFVTGATTDALSPEFRFVSNRCAVTCSLQGNEPLELTTPGDEDPWFRRVHDLAIVIDETQTQVVTQVVASNDDGQIMACLLKPANRVIRSIRHFGLVPHVREYRSSEFLGELWLDLLSVETSVDGTTWTRLRQPPSDLTEGLSRHSWLRREQIGSFTTSDLIKVQEAIEDNLSAGPERVFLANALEYARTGDLRVAVVESIICLEILLGQLLPALLAKSSIATDALTKEVTLFPRVKMLLPLLLPKEMADVDVGAVLKTISWRNNIVHKSGQLPDNIPESTVREGIRAVVSLALMLAGERDSLKRAPQLQRLSEDIATRFAIRAPTIKWAPRHLFSATFSFYLDAVPSMERLAEVADALVARLTQLDPRCRSDSDLFVFFTRFGKEIATWQGGRFIELRPPDEPVKPVSEARKHPSEEGKS